MQVQRAIRDFVSARRESILLALMLASLHIALWVEVGSPLSRAFMLVHLGLFLIWQPVWRGDQKLAWHNGVLFMLLTLAVVTWINWWLLTGWTILLTGFCGGRVALNRQQRAMYMLTLLFLVSLILIRCTPLLFDIDIPQDASNLFGALLPFIPLVIALMPSRPEAGLTGSVDYVHAIATATLATLVVVASVLVMYRGKTEYLVSLFETLTVIVAFLLVISWLLTPRAGFSGLSQLWLRSILNIGTPFEQWLSELAALFRHKTSAEEFLKAAMQELAALPWVGGVEWNSPHSAGDTGQRSRHVAEFEFESFTVRVHSRSAIGGALKAHCKLLVQLINSFYVAKLQEQELTKRTHLQAIHETGARVTHDIKNILQSLQAITSLIVHDQTAKGSVSQQLVRRQLPHLTQRLQLALDKLQAPAKSRQEKAYLKDWWRDLKTRNNDQRVTFRDDIVGDPVIPADLFDSVVENLLENLREKEQLEPGVQATVTVFSGGDHVRLAVCDTGTRIPEEKARRLLREPLSSDSGLGIGLYQAARQAEALGYRLSISHNEDGNVCFELSSEATEATTAQSP